MLKANMFAGVRVLDLSTAMTGPLASNMLAQLGAEVIKVEQPNGGDEVRSVPPLVGENNSYPFAQLNNSCRSIAVNLKHPEGREAIERIAKVSDVFLQNFTPGAIGRLGLGYDRLSEVNPRLIYCSISGFGQTGPLSHKKAYDSVVQAMGGVMAITGEENGPPTKSAVQVADVGTGMFAAFAIVSALYERVQTGKGQSIDLAMFDSVLSMHTINAMEYLNKGKLPVRRGTGHRSRVPSGTFPCKGGALLFTTIGQKKWADFSRALNRPEWLTDERFTQEPARFQNRAVVEAAITEALQERTAVEWVEILEQAGLTGGPVWDFADIFAHPHVAHREMVTTVQSVDGDPLKLIPMPFRFDGEPSRIRSRPPLLGEHTSEVLTSLAGYSPEEAARLAQAGAVKSR